MVPKHETIRVAEDGLCILHAFKECVGKARGDEISLSDIKQKFKREMSDAFYHTFFTEIIIKEQAEQVLLNPLSSFNSDACDMFLAVKIKIYQFILREC